MTRVRRLALRILADMRLSVLAIWRGVVGVYKSDDLTFASSIAYYSLLSLFPFFLLVFSILGSATANPGDRAAIFHGSSSSSRRSWTRSSRRGSSLAWPAAS